MTVDPTRATVPYFYKYSRCSDPDRLKWLGNIILKHEFYFPLPSELNDPTDGRAKLTQIPGDQLSAHLYSEFAKRNPALTSGALEKHKERIQQLVEQHPGEMAGLIAEDLGTLVVWRIYSLSKRFDNMAMWSRYADDHKGYCLELINDERLFGPAFEVRYGEKPTNDPTASEQTAHFLFSKSVDWSNEEEVRFILPVESGPIVKVDPRLLSRIILGKDMPNEHVAIIREWAQLRTPPLDVVIAQYDVLNQQLYLVE